MVGRLRFGLLLVAFPVALASASCASGKARDATTPDGTGAPAAAGPSEERSTSNDVASAPPATPAASPIPSDGRRRIFAVQPQMAKILQKPDSTSPLIGLIRAGQGVPLATGKPLTGDSLGTCKNGWYEVLPRGVVCLNDLSTLDESDPRVGAARLALPDASKDLPYFVGTSIGAPAYARIPTRAEQTKSEPGLAKHLEGAPPPNDVDGGAVDRKAAGSGPPAELLRYYASVKPRLLADESAYTGRKIAWSREFDAEGRTWLLTADMTLVPKDKVRTKATPELQGIDLKAEGAPGLPLAYAWTGDVKKWKRDPSGVLVETGEVWPRQAFFGVTTQSTRGPGGLYYKTTDDHYVRNDMVTILKKKDGKNPAIKKGQKWIHVRVTWGYLVAYEGDTPVFATAISPGMDGITERPQGHTTKRGIYPVGWKLVSADMNGVDKGKEWAVDEVPFVGYYRDSYAVHGAYWHDEFGRPKSHGCINMAPKDARWLWSWMDPAMPEGWYAVAAAPGMGVPFTWIDVRP